MFTSLTSRIAALGIIVVLSLLVFAALLVDASMKTRASFDNVAHSASVIETTNLALMELREAESGQRGFVLTRSPIFAQTFEQRVKDSREAINRVVALTADNDLQTSRAQGLRTLIDQRIASLRETMELARRGSFDEAKEAIAGGRGRELMTSASIHAQGFLEQEHALQAQRANLAEQRLARVQWLALIGGPLISVLVLLVSLMIIRGIRRPVGIIQDAMTSLGAGDRDARIASAMGSQEFASLASGYNVMVDQLKAAVSDRSRSEEELQIANAELLRNSEALRDRGEVIELLGGMAHRMQSARTDEELAQVIHVFVPRVLPGVSGVLYAHNNSRNLLIRIADWGNLTAFHNDFAPDQCWALRRGQSHFVTAPGTEIVCGHVQDKQGIYHCEPLLAGGEVIGTLYLQGMIAPEYRFPLTVMTENIASALFNHHLQRGLREQTIRDPLTGLFNRRYMEETLALEIARAARSDDPLSLVMCDVDHFKRFNDEFGHEAGDIVLQAVATEMRNHFRDGDVVCRFGGEEFTIIAPQTSPETLLERVEHVRELITRINLRHAGQTLGNTSMSFGIASWSNRMDREGSALIQAADAALYRAKREGRNRVLVAPLATGTPEA